MRLVSQQLNLDSPERWTLVDVLFLGSKPPCFALPLFATRSSNALYYQITTEDDEVAGFSEIEGDPKSNLRFDWGATVTVTPGQKCIFAFIASYDDFCLGVRPEVVRYLQKKSATWRPHPFLSSEVGQFLKDKSILLECCVGLEE